MIAGHLPRRVPDVKRRLREAVDRCTREHPRGRTCHLAANSWKVLKDHRKLRLTAARWAAEREWGGGGPTATISLAPMAQREPCGRATPRSSVPVVDMRIAGVGGRASCEKSQVWIGPPLLPEGSGLDRYSAGPQDRPACRCLRCRCMVLRGNASRAVGAGGGEDETERVLGETNVR